METHKALFALPQNDIATLCESVKKSIKKT